MPTTVAWLPLPRSLCASEFCKCVHLATDKDDNFYSNVYMYMHVVCLSFNGSGVNLEQQQ